MTQPACGLSLQCLANHNIVEATAEQSPLDCIQVICGHAELKLCELQWAAAEVHRTSQREDFTGSLSPGR